MTARFGMAGLMVAGLTLGLARAEERVVTDAKGRIVAVPLPMPAEFLNPWPEAEEEALKDRMDYVICQHNRSGSFGNTYFENEKASYPNTKL